MKRTLTVESIELLLEELDYDMIHNDEPVASRQIGNYLFEREKDYWTVEKYHNDKQGNLTSVEFIIRLSDNFYHKEAAKVMLTAIK